MPLPSLDNPPNVDLFRVVQSLEQDELGVDRKSGKINGVAVMQLGELSQTDSRSMFVDEATLDQVVEFGNQKNNGLKVRYTHPNMSNDGLGTQVGKATNFRREGDLVRADVQLSQVAKTSPKGNLFDHLLDLAEEYPEDFGMSLAAKGFDKPKMKEGKRLGDGFEPIRFRGLHAVDFVDNPAATKGGLFSVEIPEIDLRDVPYFATQILDQLFPSATEQTLQTRLNGFLNHYFANRFGTHFSKENSMSGQETETETVENQTETETVETKTEPGAKETETETVETPTEPAQLSVAQIERQRIRQIQAIGNTFNADSKVVNELIDADFSVADARELLKERFSKNERINGLDDGGDPETNTEPKEPTPEERFGAEFDEAEHQFDVSREDYINSRMIDAGLKTLKTGSDAAK